jgi:hypothetical protein
MTGRLRLRNPRERLNAWGGRFHSRESCHYWRTVAGLAPDGHRVFAQEVFSRKEIFDGTLITASSRYNTQDYKIVTD